MLFSQTNLLQGEHITHECLSGRNVVKRLFKMEMHEISCSHHMKKT